MVFSFNTALGLAIAALNGLNFDMTTRPIIRGNIGLGAIALACMLLPNIGSRSKPRNGARET